jgi:hypothetical protein
VPAGGHAGAFVLGGGGVGGCKGPRGQGAKGARGQGGKGAGGQGGKGAREGG